MNKLIIIFIVLFFLNSCNKSECETFFVPEGFTGRVFVLFNFPNGEIKQYNKGCREYKIPSDGILYTQFENNDGVLSNYTDNFTLYYSNDNNSVNIIPIRNVLTISPNDSIIQMYDFSRGSYGDFQFITFYIGTYKTSNIGNWQSSIDTVFKVVR
jgi:hypothetical protein